MTTTEDYPPTTRSSIDDSLESSDDDDDDDDDDSDVDIENVDGDFDDQVYSELIDIREPLKVLKTSLSRRLGMNYK